MITSDEQENMVKIKHLLDAQNELLSIADVFTIADNISKQTAFSRDQILGFWKDFLARGCREMGMIDTILALRMHQVSGMNKIIELARQGIDDSLDRAVKDAQP